MFALCCVKPVMRIESDAHVRAFHKLTYCMCVFVCVWAQHIVKITGPLTLGSLNSLHLLDSFNFAFIFNNVKFKT